jgi:hypothetical protein
MHFRCTFTALSGGQWTLVGEDPCGHDEPRIVRQAGGISVNTTTIPRLSRQLILIGTPVLLVLVELTHPSMPTQANAGWWVAIHVIQLPLFGLFALALLLLLDGAHGVAATLSRVGVGVFVVFYTFLDAISGRHGRHRRRHLAGAGARPQGRGPRWS